MPEIDMLEDAEFEGQLTAMGDNQLELIKFVARHQFSTSKVLVDHGRRIKSLEKKNKKAMGVVGASGAIIASAVAALIDYFMRR